MLFKIKLFLARIVFCFQTILYIIYSRLEAIRHHNLVFFVLTPQHENLGDQALACAGKMLIEASGQYPFEITGDLLSRFVKYPLLLKILFKDRKIIFQAGGYLGSFWYGYGEAIVRRVLEITGDNEIIILPQTIYYDDTEEGRRLLESSLPIYNACSRLTICAREHDSYDKMREYYPNANVKLFPDIVLFLDKLSFNEKRSGAMITLRDDVEKTMADDTRQKLISLMKKSFSEVRVVDMICDKRVSPSQRNAELEKHFLRFARSELVVTDRLHGMIFSYITGTPCAVFNSKSPKVRGLYNWMLSDCGYIRFVDSVEQLNDFIIECKSGLDFTDSTDKAAAYYDELVELLKA